MNWIITIFCSVGLLSDCPEPTSSLEDEVDEFIEQVENTAQASAEAVIPTNNSNLISDQSWGRAMELRPLFVDAVINEFNGNMVWLGVLISLSHTESRNNPDAVSWVGAEGNMQIMPQTNRRLAATICRNIPNKSAKHPPYAIPCASRLLKQNIQVVKVSNGAGDCNIIGIGALRPYNEGPGWTNRARALAVLPDDINSVAAVKIKSKANELQTDQYVVKILRKWMPEYRKSNYFVADDICEDYVFELYGVTL